jgi:hypothetical protein
MNTYGVTVKRDDDLWVALIDGLPEGVVGAADYEHFADLHADVPELVADLTDSDPSDFALNWRYELNGQDVTLELRRFLDLDKELRHVQHEHERARQEALAAMADAGLSQRVMADVLQLSHQRIHQLVS